MGQLIRDIYNRVIGVFKANSSTSNNRLTFSQLLPKDATKEAKVFTFMPMLNLAHVNYRTVDLEQQEHFWEIVVILRSGLNEAASTATSGKANASNQSSN